MALVAPHLQKELYTFLKQMLSQKGANKSESGTLYSITSMARTRMARLPWMIRTLFSVPTKFFQ